MTRDNGFDKAIKTACNILSYMDNTESQLRRKLREKGYNGDEIDCAVEYVQSKGWLNEERMLEAAVNTMANGKLYGKSRIIAELRAKGYKSETISAYDFTEIDFTAICERLYEKHGGIPDDKTKAYLARHGHTGSDIRKACSRSGGTEGTFGG